MVSLFALILLAAPASQPATADDLTTVRQRYIQSVVPDNAAARDEIRHGGERAAKTIGENGTWSDIDFSDQARSVWKARQHLERAALMARAYAVTNDAALLAKTKSALDYWLAHDFKNPNWWHNEIGTPMLVGEIDILLGPELSEKQKEKSLEILRRSDWKKWTGQNLCWGVGIQIQRGLIEDNPDTIRIAYDRLHQEIRNDAPEGIMPDWSFHQHGPQLYNGGYGLGFAGDVPRLVSYAWRTRWQIPDDRLRILTSFLLDGEQWMFRNGRIDYSTVGREITRKGKTAVNKSWTDGPVSPTGATYGLPRSMQFLADLEIPRREEFKNFAARLMDDPHAPPLVGNRHFWWSDYMVHQRPAWFASVKMFSTRMQNAEIVNAEGLKSHHLSDGANLLYLTGDEYVDIFPVWDWTKIPGTTAEQGTLEIEKKPVGVKGKTSFVSGVSDGTYGLAAMELARGQLTARKCWIFLDDSYVCLGAGITCKSDNPVATSVNQCLLQGQVIERSTWLHHANVGYLFPGHQNFKYTFAEQQGRWSDIGTGSKDLVRKGVFNCWIDHGVKSDGASYVYQIFPAVTSEQMEAHAAEPRVEILANSADVQAIRCSRLGLTAIVFWKAGKVGDVEVDQPCLLLSREQDGKTIVTVSNPENRALTVNVKVAEQLMQCPLPSGAQAGASAAFSLSPRGRG